MNKLKEFECIVFDENDAVEVMREVHALGILTYNQTLTLAGKNYNLYPDYIKDWKEATKKEIIKWLQSQIDSDDALESICEEVNA